MSGFWINSQKDNAQLLITHILSDYQSNSNEFKMSINNIIACTELGYSSTYNIKYSEVFEILKIMFIRNLTTVNDFEKIYQQINSKNESSWKIYIPLHTNLDNNVKTPLNIKILDKDFVFKRLIDIDDKDRIIQCVSKMTRDYHDYQKNDQLYIYIEVNDKTWNSALSSILEAFDLLRGIISYVTTDLYFRISSTGFDPRTKIPHPYVMIFSNNNIYENAYFMVDQKVSNIRYTLSETLVSDIIKMSNHFLNNPAENSIISLCIDSLRIYAQAMEAQFSYNCFLGLWQMAEAMTIPKETIGGKSDDLRKRLEFVALISHNNLIGTGYKNLLKHFVKLRNDLAHRGTHDIIDDNDVNILNFICRNYLEWLIYFSSTFPDKEHLKKLFLLIDHYPKDKEITDSIINFIKSSTGI